MSCFIKDRHFKSHLDSENLEVRWVDFDVNAYRDNLFNKYKVDFPTSLQNAVNKRKSEYLAGRYCAISALESLGYPGEQISADEKRCPLFPQGSVGSITHSKAIALAAVCRSNTIQLGVDFEKIVDSQQAQQLTAMILKPEEMQVFINQGIEEKLAFTTVFSLKESFFKAAYPAVKHYFGFEAVKVIDLDLDSNICQFQVCQDLMGAYSQGEIFQAKFTWFDEMVLTSVIL